MFNRKMKLVPIAMFVLILAFAPAVRGQVIINDDFNSLSSSYIITNPSGVSVSNNLLHLAASSGSFSQVAIPISSFPSVTVTASITAHSFDRFQIAVTNQTGMGNLGWNTNIVAVEFDSGTASCGNFIWEAASNWNDTYLCENLSPSDSHYYATETSYRLQITVNASTATWSLLDSSGFMLQSYSDSIPQQLRFFSTPTYSFDYSSMKYITIGILSTGPTPSSYDVDSITVTDPGSSSTTTTTTTTTPPPSQSPSTTSGAVSSLDIIFLTIGIVGIVLGGTAILLTILRLKKSHSSSIVPLREISYELIE